jgi:hypothetical protein
MLSFNTTSRIKQVNAAIATSLVIRLQAAFLQRLLKANNLLSNEDPARVSLPLLQEIALAPKVSPGYVLADSDLPKLVELLFEAYTSYVTAYAVAGFPDPARAALHAMQSYEVTCT